MTGKPPATLRLRHPGAPAPDKKKTRISSWSLLFSQNKVFVWSVEAGLCGANVACWGRLRYSCGFVAPVKGNVPGDLLLSCVIWHNGESGDVTTEGDAPWRTQGGSFLLE